jgi:hypothetical protein
VIRRDHVLVFLAGGLAGVCACAAGLLLFLSLRVSLAALWDLVPGEPGATPTPRPAATATALPDTRARPPAGRIGEVVEAGGYSLSVVAVEHPARPECDPWYYPPPGTKLVAVDIVVGCLSGEAATANPLLAVLVDRDGVAYMAQLGALARHNELVPRPIGPGESARGRVAFELPEAAVPASLKYIFPHVTLQVDLAE